MIPIAMAIGSPIDVPKSTQPHEKSRKGKVENSVQYAASLCLQTGSQERLTVWEELVTAIRPDPSPRNLRTRYGNRF
jgi:hypothetical protein